MSVLSARGRLSIVVAVAALAAVPHQSAQASAAQVFRGALVDLQPSAVSPLDGARAQVTLASAADRTTVVLRVHGVAAPGTGHTYGAHLHVGPCVAGNGAAALGHYNQTAITGGPMVVSDETEVWLDFTVDDDGDGVAVAHVPFVPVPGNRSVVIHAAHTDPITGLAGARLACLPVAWS